MKHFKAIIIHSDRQGAGAVHRRCGPWLQIQSDPELIGELELCQLLPRSADYMEELAE